MTNVARATLSACNTWRILPEICEDEERDQRGDERETQAHHVHNPNTTDDITEHLQSTTSNKVQISVTMETKVDKCQHM